MIEDFEVWYQANGKRPWNEREIPNFFQVLANNVEGESGPST